MLDRLRSSGVGLGDFDRAGDLGSLGGKLEPRQCLLRLAGLLEMKRELLTNRTRVGGVVFENRPRRFAMHDPLSQRVDVVENSCPDGPV